MKQIISLLFIMMLCTCTAAMAQVTISVDEPEVFTEAEAAINDAVQSAIDEVEEAQARVKAVREALKTGKATPKEATKAESLLQTKQQALDSSRVKALAEQSELSEAEIESMRASGKGWGVIAKEAGIHPSALGKAKGKNKNKAKKQKNGYRINDAEGAGNSGNTKANNKKSKGKKQ